MSATVWYCPICQVEGVDADVKFCRNDGARVRSIAERGSEWIGKVIAERYRVVRFIDAGGTADVYEAERLGSGKRVALKLLHAAHDERAGASESFQREAQMVSLIAHPNVVAIDDFGTIESGKYYMVMELLEGRSVAKHLEGGALPVALALKYAMQACEGLEAAHARDVLHCDVKPANFILHQPAGAEPVLKILDLGIGRMLGRASEASGVVSGTPEYMSPEQAKGLPLHPVSDVYSMGVTVWEMLLGVLPFEHESYLEVLQMQLRATPEWPSARAAARGVPAQARDVLLKALQKDPARRHGSMVDLQIELASIAREVRARTATEMPPSMRPRPRESMMPPGSSLRPIPRAAAVPRITASGVVQRVSLEGAAGADDEVVEIAPDVLWVGRRRNQLLEHNAFLLVLRDGDGAACRVLVDPGPPDDLSVVSRKVASVIGSFDRLDFVFLTHADPDAAANAASIQQASGSTRVVCSDETFRAARHHGLDPKRFVPTDGFPAGVWSLPTGHLLVVLPTPFCHARGAVMLLDPDSRVLFSGDLFSGARAPGLVATERGAPGIEAFHQLYMPSRRALSVALERVRRLDPRPTVIAPQHGGVLVDDDVARVVERLDRLEVGPDRRDASEDEAPFVAAANDLAREWAEAAGSGRARDLLADHSADASFPRLFSLDAEGRIAGFEVAPRLALDALAQDALAALPAEVRGDLKRSLQLIFREHGLAHTATHPPPALSLSSQRKTRA